MTQAGGAAAIRLVFIVPHGWRAGWQAVLRSKSRKRTAAHRPRRPEFLAMSQVRNMQMLAVLLAVIN